jgi:predicted nucleic acid-binding protein
LIATPGLSCNDVPDVYLAALAIERGLTLATHDHGFGRFTNLRWVDPLA